MARTVFLSIVLVGMCFTVGVKAEEAESDNYYKTVTTPEGLTFRVPEDMPIEKRNGIVAPVPFEEYIYGKFRKLDARVHKLEKTTANMEERLTALEKKAAGVPSAPPSAATQEKTTP